MSKIVQNVRAFRRRVLIGGADLWVVVEGKNHDRAFYDQVLRASPSTRTLSVKVRLAEQLSVGGVVAGGKQHALSLHDALEGMGALLQHNGVSDRAVAFMLDRDNEDFLGTANTKPHIIHTKTADVEAEILTHAKMMRAIANAHGLSKGDVRRLSRVTAKPASHLALVWREWIVLRLVALECSVENLAPTGAPSIVNVATYGATDPVAVALVENKLSAAVPAAQLTAARSKVTSWVDAAFARGEEHELVKGKWVARYAEYLVAVHLTSVIMRAGLHADHIVIAALSALKYRSPMIDHYEARLSRVFPSVLAPSVPASRRGPGKTGPAR